MERLTRRLSYGDVVAWNPLKYYNYNDFKKVLELLAEYEDIGLTPQEIEQMKARMPLHQWAGESPDKMSIFGVSVANILELTKADKQGLLVTLPCKIGDTVYRVCKKKYDVDGYGMQWEEGWGIVTNAFHLGMFHEIGKNVFLTREEAKEVLRSK